eukprot:GSChrysophyteH1.ASY1.ANO1.409.1 assembled CDS
MTTSNGGDVNSLSESDYAGDVSTVSTMYLVTAMILFVLLAFQLLFPSNSFLPLDRRTSSVTCAVLVYITHKFLLKNDVEVDLIEAVDFDVLLLLSAIMIINFIVIHLKETRACIDWCQKLIQQDPIKGFWMVSFAALLSSPFLTNDGVCLLLVAPILSAFEGLESDSDEEELEGTGREVGPLLQSFRIKLRRSDAIYFMLSLACSSNIGSALTYTGNPQNMIVASDSIEVLPPWKFLLYMIVPVTFSFLLSTYYIQYCWVSAREKMELEEKHRGLYLNSCFPGFSVLTRYPEEDERNNELSDDEEAAYRSATGTPTSKSTRSRSNSFGSESSRSRASKNKTTPQPKVTAFICGKEALELPQALSPAHPETVVEKIGRIVISPYPYLLLALVAVMIIMIFVDVMSIAGLIVTSAVVMVITLVLGNHWREAAVWKDRESSPLLTESSEDRARQLEAFFESMFDSIDYNLLFIFGGLFVVVANIESTGAPKRLWDWIAGDKAFQSSGSITGICIFVALASQFLGNVAVCQLVKPYIQPLSDDNRRLAWALVSFVST